MAEALGVPAPEFPDVELVPALLADSRVARDFNGGLVYADLKAWLRENLEDDGERAAIEWAVYELQAERAAVNEERDEARAEEAAKEKG